MIRFKKIFKQIMQNVDVHTIRTKLIIYFLIIGLVPLVTFALFANNIYFNALSERITGYSREVVYRMERDIDKYFQDIESFLTREQDFYINQFIKLTQVNDFYNNRKYTFRIWEDFNNLKDMKPGLEDIALTFADGKRISSYGLYYVNFNEVYQQMIDSLQSRGIAVIGPHTNFLEKNVVTMVRPYYPETTDEIVLISADINLDVLADIANVKLGNNGYVFIADQKGNIIYHPDQSLIGQQSPFFQKISGTNLQGSFVAQDDEYILTSTISQVTGWSIVGIAYASEIEAELTSLKNITMLIIGIILVGIILLATYLSYSLSHPIRELEKLTQLAANNDLSVQINTKGNDEIAQLGMSFNKMINRIKHLMEENIAEQKMLRKLEMESLDNQIKPHFIYNTLDLIIGQLESNNSSRAIQLLEALGNFFRLSLSHGYELVRISSELEHVKNYLFIQQFRYGEKYEYLIDIQDRGIMNKYIPRLLLQPLVENAICHGILKSEKKGLIIVKAYLKENHIYLEVIDNGAGISAEKVAEINDILKGKKEAEDKKQYFGLRNVNQRIKLKYGPECGLWLESKPGVKTSSIIKISQIEVGEADA